MGIQYDTGFDQTVTTFPINTAALEAWELQRGNGSSGGNRGQTAETDMLTFTNIFPQSPPEVTSEDPSHSPQDFAGEQLWKDTQFADFVQNGELGSAASVSKYLQENGMPYANSADVANLADQLKQNNWKDAGGVENARPGDIVYATGTRGEIGVVDVAADGKLVLYHNVSSEDPSGKIGTWQKTPLQYSTAVEQNKPEEIHVLRRGS